MWPEKHGKTYRVRDLVAGSKVTIASGYRTKTAAKEAIAVMKADQLRGEWVDPRAGSILLAEWVAIWWPTHKLTYGSETSVKSEGGRIKNHILPLLGQYEVGEIDPLVVKAWVAQMLAGDEELDREPLAPKSIRNVHGLLYAIMQEAVVQRIIRTNPCARTGLPKIEHKEQRYLTDAEIARLVLAMPPHWRPLVVLLVSTGLRWSEAAGLRVKTVDVLARSVRVEEVLHELSAGGDLVVGPPKTDKSRRTVTVPAAVAELLVPLVSMRERDAHVFLGPDGGDVRYRKFWRIFVRCAAAAGLEGLRIHDLRHTHAAHLISAGVPLTGVQRRLGHASIMVTSDLYGHLLPVVDENIIAAVEASLAKIDLGGIVGEMGGGQRGATRFNKQELAGQAA